MYRPIPQDGARVLRVDVPTADISLTPVGGNEVEAELVLGCKGDYKPCMARASELRLAARRDNDVQVIGFTEVDKFRKKPKQRGERTTRLWVDRTTRKCGINSTERTYFGKEFNRAMRNYGWVLSADLDIRYPEYQRLELAMGEGSIQGELRMSSDIQIDHGAVDLVANSKHIGRVSLSVDKGVVTLIQPSGRAEKRKKFEWTGEGDGEVSIVVKRGSVRLKLL